MYWVNKCVIELLQERVSNQGKKWTKQIYECKKYEVVAMASV